MEFWLPGWWTHLCAGEWRALIPWGEDVETQCSGPRPHLCASSFDWYWFVPIYNKPVIVSVVLSRVLWVVLANQTWGVVGTSEFIARWLEMWEAQGPPKCSWYLKYWGPSLNCGVWWYSGWLVSELHWSTLVSVRIVLYFYYNST